MKITRGPITTDKKLVKPTIPKIANWYEDMKLIVERSGYQAYLTGRSLTDIENTYDVDVVFLGELKLDKLEELLISCITTGFRHNILVDARWQSQLDTIEYKDKKITVLPTEFIYLNYFEQDYETGYKIINDYRLNPAFKVVSENLVSSNYNRSQPSLKSHITQYIVKHGKLPSLLLNDFNKE